MEEPQGWQLLLQLGAFELFSQLPVSSTAVRRSWSQSQSPSSRSGGVRVVRKMTDKVGMVMTSRGREGEDDDR